MIFYEINNNVNLISLNDDLLFYGKAQRVKKFYRRVKQIKSICISNKITILFCMNISMITSAVFALFNEKTKVIGSERSNPYISLKGSIKQITKKIIPLFVDGFVFQTESASMFYPKKVRKKVLLYLML